jgi:thymidylate synthase (FAD)
MGTANDLLDDMDEKVYRDKKALEQRGKKIDVLDQGFVKLVDFMGNDKRICDAARVSFDADSEVKTIEDDEKLIDYLMRNRHTSPFEMVEFAFEMKLPIFVARQFIRHRMCNVNEISGRYTQLPEEFFIPEDFHEQSEKNKQGRKDAVIEDSHLLKYEYNTHIRESFEIYRNLLALGVSKEEARYILPLSTYTRWFWKCDLHNLLHLLGLRADGHAQKEIRDYANAIIELIRPVVPIALEAWERNIFNGVQLNSKEVKLVKYLLEPVKGIMDSFAIVDSRELRILRDKLGL